MQCNGIPTRDVWQMYKDKMKDGKKVTVKDKDFNLNPFMTTPPEPRTPLYPLGDLAKLKQDEGQAPSSPQIGAVTRADLRPLVPLIIYWTNGSITQTNALVDTGAEASLIYRNPKNFKGLPITATGLGGSEIQTKQVKATMSIMATSP